jgi:uncharacterized repeat protein (TIGR01451 family)/fimbrial isopeptide formation D2 family protein
MCDAPPAQLTAQIYAADGVTPAGPALSSGSDYSSSFDQAQCRLSFALTNPAVVIAPDQHLIISYESQLDNDTQRNAVLTNVAAVTEWFSGDNSGPSTEARQYNRALTDGTVGILDHEDAHTLVEFTPELIFEKTVVNVSTGADPGTVASPGDRLRYTLRVENTSDTVVNNFSLVDELDQLNAVTSFQPGTLTVISAPAGADTGNTNPNGGASGTGILDVRNLSLGGTGSTVVVVFEVTLAPVLGNGTYVSNQSLLAAGFPVAVSDDPNINGQADPNIGGDEDPTRVLIQSAPEFVIQKTAAYLGADPNVLLAGDLLRYRITVRNVGDDNASGVELTDPLPANVTYLPGSTTLNGNSVPDAAGDTLPLIDGLLINAPQDTAPGVMNAGVADNVAVITFDVLVDRNVPDGTVLSNQAFVSAAPNSILNLPSDDPRTDIPDDPTRDVVGNVPLLYAEKSVELATDNNTTGIVDPSDTLLYTITVYNNGFVPATDVVLTDAVPANTTYIEDTTTLNGVDAGRPDGGVFPLIAGLPISSGDLTPPLPLPGAGTLSPGESATIQFEVLVDSDAAVGTLISNQAVVSSEELADLLTDGDGNPATGPEPTVVVVGDQQQLSIDKQVSVVGGGLAEPGSTFEYLITVTNVGSVPAFSVEIFDDLALPVAGQLTYVDQSATLNGAPVGITINGSQITADFSATYGALQPGDTIELRFRALVDDALSIGTTVTNTAEVRWNNPQQLNNATVSLDLGGVPNAGVLTGTVWHDADFDNQRDANEERLQGWTVELLRDGRSIVSTQTGQLGNYRISAASPNNLSGEGYELRFSAPGANSTTASLGQADSEFTNLPQRIADIIITPGSNLQNLNLPIDPNGVVYNALTRGPVAGATVTLLANNNGSPLPDSCFDDPAQQGQVTLPGGHYKFDLNFSSPACNSGGNYTIQVTAPDDSFVPGVSDMIPPADDPAAGAFSVPGCPSSAYDTIFSPPGYCEVQPSEYAPASGVQAGSAGTTYFMFVSLDASAAPGTSQIFNNHIPLDPDLSGSVAITKTTPLVNVSRGQLVPYTITVNNSNALDLPNTAVVDRYPAGFRYVEGSARVDGIEIEPEINGLELRWSGLTLPASDQLEIQLILAVSAGVSEGEFINRAQALNDLNQEALTGEASATVRVVPDPTFDCTDVIGKVFDDDNRNGYQDAGESGIGGVRLVTARGLAVTTDAEGRFHITCAIVPNEKRGSNFVLKLDDRTLPSGYRPSTRDVQVKRATRGKALRFNFGASIHRVVSMDLADPVFVPGSTELRDMWKPRLGELLAELKKSPSVLRLAYLGDVEDRDLAESRVKAIKKQIDALWTELDCCYDLVIETDVHWRLGGPPEELQVSEGVSP